VAINEDHGIYYFLEEANHAKFKVVPGALTTAAPPQG
jgi:YHS domain-containing protein